MRACSSFLRCAGAAVIAAAVPAVAAGQAAPARPLPLPPPAAMSQIAMADAVRLALERNHQLRAQRLNVDIVEGRRDHRGAEAESGADVDQRELPDLFAAATSSAGQHRRTTRTSSNRSATCSSAAASARSARWWREDTTDVAAQDRGRRRAAAARSRPSRRSSTCCWRSRRSISRARTSRTSRTSSTSTGERVRAGDLAEGDFYKISLQKLQFEQDVSAARGRRSCRRRRRCGRTSAIETLDRRLRRRRRSGLHEVHRDARRSEARGARGAARPAGGAEPASSWRRTRRRSPFGNRARDVTGDVEYDRAGPDQRDRLRRLDRPADPRSQPGQHRAQPRSPSRQAIGDARQATQSTVLTDVVNAYAAFQTSEKVARRSISPAISIRRSSRSTSRPTSTSRAAARCSICSTPSAPIATTQLALPPGAGRVHDQRPSRSTSRSESR